MMNIHEVMEKATPGPLTIDGTKLVSPKWLCEPCFDEDDGIRVTVIDALGAMGRDDTNADLALLAHCYNHFDELLEALKRMEEMDYGMTPGDLNGRYDAARCIIAKCENVEGI